jgi:hypothetical protein
MIIILMVTFVSVACCAFLAVTTYLVDKNADRHDKQD